MPELVEDHLTKIVRFCAIECKMQMSGEESVSWMFNAWQYAMRMTAGNELVRPTEADILLVGAMIEPSKNATGYRLCNVRVGADLKMHFDLVPRSLQHLISNMDEFTPENWFRVFEEIHPFRDGNGRSGALLYNWLRGSLNDPIWPPNYWNDTRRKPGYGA